jgi:hypothetical protein
VSKGGSSKRTKTRTFVIEAVNSVYTRTLVIAPENEKVLWVFDLVREQETDCLQALFSPVDIVTEEEVVSLWWEPTVFKQTEEIVVLPVYVAWSRKGLQSVERVGVENEWERRHLPQIFIGASSSRRMGWLMKISRAFVHKYLISYS